MEKIPTTIRGIARRKALLETAGKLFQEKGYANTSINEIVQQAGGSLSTAYKWFPSKEMLFMAVFEHRLSEIGAYIAGLSMDAATPKEAVRRILTVPYHFEAERQLQTFLFDGIRIPAFRENALKIFQENLVVPLEKHFRDIGERFHFRYRLGVELTVTLLIRTMRGMALEFLLCDGDLKFRREAVMEQTLTLFQNLIEFQDGDAR